VRPSPLPSAAFPAGGLARSYEYRTRGLPTTPRISWSFIPEAGAQFTCPILVSGQVVYVADSAGYLSASDARSGDLVWRFPTDWVGCDEEARPLRFRSSQHPEGVTAVCVDERIGYLASACDTLYELDLRSGQALRSWSAHPEPDVEADRSFDKEQIKALFLYNDQLFLIGYWPGGNEIGTFRFDPASGNTSLAIYVDLKDGHSLPTVYHDSQSETDIIFGSYVYNNHGDSGFVAMKLADPDFDHPGGVTRWYTNMESSPHAAVDPLDRLATVGFLAECNVPVMDATLYAVQVSALRPAALLALAPDAGAVKWRSDYHADFEDRWDANDPAGFLPIQLAAADHLVYVLCRDQLDAIDVQTHQLRWNWRTTFQAQHALVADGLLYVLGAHGDIVALDVQTGALRWTWRVDGDLLADYSTIDDGTLYVATTRALYALGS
jgi:outer membrane protein assembly factor BamB